MKASEINQHIVSELGEVKAMLDQKAKTLNKQERDLANEKRQFQQAKKDWAKHIDAEYQKLVKEQEAKMNRLLGVQ